METPCTFNLILRIVSAGIYCRSVMEGRETVLQPSSDWIGIYKIGKRTDSQAIRPDDGTTIWVKPCLILYFDIQLTAKPPFKYIYQSVQCQVISSVYGSIIIKKKTIYFQLLHFLFLGSIRLCRWHLNC